MNYENEPPKDKKFEMAILLHSKCVLCQMVGNNCFKHHRDYKAIIFLLEKFIEYIDDSKDKKDIECYENLKDCLNYTAEELEDSWIKIENIRIPVHKLLRDSCGYSEDVVLPPQWAIVKIRELTNS